jgi:hypothetical protein
VKVNNEEEVRRLNEFKTNLLLAIDLNSKIEIVQMVWVISYYARTL